ncbi:hypothetical protein KK062_17150 [Fulvivirgaceae bacterium PWU5]|uniref:Uncharacterized protein n=1 Tax=Dawidia cretensis TaxID=2782350 RepID=A0AAP2GQR9_9BACT|nr:hypothetical protein [Dawidia cretensis]MBT1709976.1 hypothetical protein [Dawidia cretensis]
MRHLKKPLIQLLLICSAAAAWAQHPRQVVYRDVFYEAGAQQIIFGNDSIVLAFDRRDGAWTMLQHTSRPGNLMGARTVPDFNVNGQWIFQARAVPLKDFVVDIDPYRKYASMSLTWHIDDTYELTAVYTLFPGEAVIQRRSTLRVVRKQPQDVFKLEGFRFELPRIMLGEPSDCFVHAPGSLHPELLPLPATPYGSLVNRQAIYFPSAPDMGFGLLCLENREQARIFATWMSTTGEASYTPYIKTNGQTLLLCHDNWRQQYLQQDVAVSSDPQVISLRASLKEALTHYHQTETSNDRDPAPGGDHTILTIDVHRFPSGFKAVTSRLQRYKELGFTTVQLLIHRPGESSPMNPLKIDPALGTSADLKTLVDNAHGHGLKVMFALPLDGAGPAATLSVVQAALAGLDTYDVDGYKIQGASFQKVSWSLNDRAPAYCTGHGFVSLVSSIAQATRERNPGFILILDSPGLVPYTLPVLHVNESPASIHTALSRLAAGDFTAADYQQYLSAIYRISGTGASRVLSIDAPEKSAGSSSYSPPYFCLVAIHAFFGTPDVTLDPTGVKPAEEEYYKKIFQTKKKFAALRNSDVLLDAVQASDPNIFTGVRRSNTDAVLVVINMSADTVRTNINITPAVMPATRTLLFDNVLTGAPVKGNIAKIGLQLTLPPYQVLVAPLK